MVAARPAREERAPCSSAGVCRCRAGDGLCRLTRRTSCEGGFPRDALEAGSPLGSKWVWPGPTCDPPASVCALLCAGLYLRRCPLGLSVMRQGPLAKMKVELRSAEWFYQVDSWYAGRFAPWRSVVFTT